MGVRIAPKVFSNLLELIRVPVALVIHRRVVKENVNRFHQLVPETVNARLAPKVFSNLLVLIRVLVALLMPSVVLVSGDHHLRLP